MAERCTLFQHPALFGVAFPKQNCAILWDRTRGVHLSHWTPNGRIAVGVDLGGGITPLGVRHDAFVHSYPEPSEVRLRFPGSHD